MRFCEQHGVVAKDIAVGAGGPGFSSFCRKQLATAATFLRSCVAQALSRGDTFVTGYTLR